VRQLCSDCFFMLVHCCRIQALEAKRVSDSPSTGSLVTPHLPALSQGRHDSPAHARHARCTCGHVADLPFGKATVKSFLQPVSNHSLYDPDFADGCATLPGGDGPRSGTLHRSSMPGNPTLRCRRRIQAMRSESRFTQVAPAPHNVPHFSPVTGSVVYVRD
jgi:hypothetical protein